MIILEPFNKALHQSLNICCFYINLAEKSSCTLTQNKKPSQESLLSSGNGDYTL